MILVYLYRKVWPRGVMNHEFENVMSFVYMHIELAVRMAYNIRSADKLKVCHSHCQLTDLETALHYR